MADARRYPALFDAGLPVCFDGLEFTGKAEADREIDATMPRSNMIVVKSVTIGPATLYNADALAISPYQDTDALFVLKDLIRRSQAPHSTEIGRVADHPAQMEAAFPLHNVFKLASAIELQCGPFLWRRRLVPPFHWPPAVQSFGRKKDRERRWGHFFHTLQFPPPSQFFAIRQ